MNTDTTFDVTNSYDRRGRLTNTLSGATSLTKIYSDAGSLLRESYTGGPLNGISITNRYDEFLRRTNVSILNAPSSILAATAYAYDSASRLQTVSDGPNRATYSFLANAPLVAQIVFAANDTTVMTTTKGYDFVNRLTNTTTLDVGLGTLDTHAYAYNPANQRTSATNVDGSYWVYAYDTLGQVLSGRKYWSDNTPVAGQQFDYTFDDIGNRQTTTRDARSATYTPNTLNQYTSRTVPGFVNVLGTATNTATVSLWSKDSTALFTPTTRKGDYFRGEMPFNNNTGAMWLTITNVAVLSNATGADIVTNIVGKALLAKTPEAFTYDADGNLTSDSLWTNVWNGENRRTIIESRTTLPAAAKVKEQWTILADGRWIERIVSTNNGTSYYSSLTNRYVWDGPVLLAVLDHTNGVVMSFLRGLDLSGSIQGAGGVGGLLAVQVGPAGPAGLAGTTHFTCYDGNGNVAALVNAATGVESARYERGPFAERVRETGPMAKLNPIRFSTQYHDDFTDDTKYLFRDLREGRWLSRDPIQERGGKNLYGFVSNNPLNRFDPFGHEEKSCNPPFGDAKDSMEEILKKLPPGKVEGILAALKKGVALKDLIDQATEASDIAALVVAVMESGDQEAMKGLLEKVGEAALKDALAKAGVNNIFAAGIMEGGAIGTGLGNSIKDSIVNINKGVGCQRCGSCDLDKDPGEYKAVGYRCYKSCTGKIWLRVKLESKNIKENSFLDNVFTLFEKPQYIWVKCDNL